MGNLNVRIERLEPLHVASVHAFGPSPEGEAWAKLVAWAEPRKLLADPDAHRIFGFNNPNPSAGSPNYGYEFWIEVDEDVQADPVVTVKTFGGGLYAVTRCKGVEQYHADVASVGHMVRGQHVAHGQPSVAGASHGWRRSVAGGFGAGSLPADRRVGRRRVLGARACRRPARGRSRTMPCGAGRDWPPCLSVSRVEIVLWDRASIRTLRGGSRGGRVLGRVTGRDRCSRAARTGTGASPYECHSALWGLAGTGTDPDDAVRRR